MESLLAILALVAEPWISMQACKYGTEKCAPGEVCVKVSSKEARCRHLPAYQPFIIFPMEAGEVWCDQGVLSPEGNTHTFNKTSFALDLASSRDLPASAVTAGSDGKVIAYSECSLPNDECGNGFGNYVMLLREDGFLLFHAHLDEVKVKTGDRVKAGQALGIEGNTGLTGENNRHLHFSVHYDWRKLGFDYLKDHIGHLPDSAPFRMNVCQSQRQVCKGKFQDVQRLKCSRTTGTIDWLKVL